MNWLNSQKEIDNLLQKAFLLIEISEAYFMENYRRNGDGYSRDYMIEQELYERFYCSKFMTFYMIKTKCYVCGMDPPWVTQG
ncbi:hypothetical protein H5410_017059 [Solanum commersonii]|uniref:Uncharacterized protein n=1 Tax=Solanum commersonii TaxID=4109 RepID=A0A9J5ZYU4_SOLCO|nr:hypothetical protein H5410_017059 [Solanum commersonii]